MNTRPVCLAHYILDSYCIKIYILYDERFSMNTGIGHFLFLPYIEEIQKTWSKRYSFLTRSFFIPKGQFFQPHTAYGYTIGTFLREVKCISTKNPSIFLMSEGHTFLTEFVPLSPN